LPLEQLLAFKYHRAIEHGFDEHTHLTLLPKT
jgi:hypothetical protein